MSRPVCGGSRDREGRRAAGRGVADGPPWHELLYLVPDPRAPPLLTDRIQGRRPAHALLHQSPALARSPRDGGRLAGGGSRSRPPSSPDPPPTVERERGVPPPPLLHRRRWERVRGGRRRGGAAPAHGLPVRGERRGRGGRRKRRPAGGAAPRGWGGRGG
jgi:hypothetical protein